MVDQWGMMWNNLTGYQQAIASGAFGALFATALLLAIFVILAFYVYYALSWAKIAKKMNFKYAWLAWIPFASEAMQLKLGKFKWAWIFLVIVPILGWIPLIVLLTMAIWRIFEKLHYAGWLALSFPAMFIPHLSLLGFIAYFVIIGIVAFKKKR